MRNFLILSTILAIFVPEISAGAQDVKTPEGTDDTVCQLSHHWYFGVESGAQLFFGRNDGKMSFGDRLAPSVDLTIGRKFSNVVGLDCTVSNSKFRGVASPLIQDANFLTGDSYLGSNPDETLKLQSGYMMNLYVRFLVDLTNWWGGVNPERKSIAKFYVGSGILSGFSKETTYPTINAGFIYMYRINDAWALNATLKGAVTDRRFDGEQCEKHFFHGLAGINIGITYAFGR